MEKKFSIAIIDDDAALASNLKDILKTESYHVEAVNDGSSGVELFREKTFDLALVDIKLPHLSGPELIKKLNRLRPETEYVLITAYASMDTAMAAVKQKQIIGYEKKPVNIDRLLSFIRQVAVRKRAEKALQQKTRDLGERIKELNCLYSISNLVEKPGISLDEIIQGTVELIPPSLQYPEITCSRFLLENKEFKTENFKEANWKQSSEIIVHGKRMGCLEICYLKEKPEIGEEPFLKEERNLINAVAERLGHILERAWAEEALRKSEKKNKMILYHMSDYVWILDLSTLRVTFISAAVEKILGYNPDEIMALDLDTLFSPGTMETVIGTIEKEVSIDEQDGVDPDRKIVIELEIIRKDGSAVWTEASFSFLRDNKRKPTSLLGITRDISARRRAEEVLRESEEKYRTILETIEDGYFEVDLGGNLTFFNDSLCKILGYPKDELLGINNRQYTDKENAKDLYQTFNRVYTTGKPDRGFDWEIIKKDGTKIIIEASISLRSDAGGEPIGFRGVVRDISEKQRLEAQLQHAKRMESVGTLAGGIAHNFNNLLMGIQGNTSMVLLDIDSNNPRHKNLKNIEKLVENGAKLTAQLIGYAREGSYEVKPTSLNQLVKETSDTFGMTKKEITVHQGLSEKLYGIKADQGQIEQVLLNLYVNAADAMPEGGDLFLKTIIVTDKDITGKPYKVQPGNYVLLTVRDTGVGMDKETRERIFEPFFTTKGLASGTGLGMASAHGIIKGHGGYIDVDSAGGKGTTFSIYLPATERMIEEKKVSSDEFVKGEG
ncbi:MAG: PAS domain S-box protein, partial [Deltaproteobacteria bacterium]|nr:PAS domain S-box protein [Deltaproteobacteria bacterium]